MGFHICLPLSVDAYGFALLLHEVDPRITTVIINKCDPVFVPMTVAWSNWSSYVRMNDAKWHISSTFFVFEGKFLHLSKCARFTKLHMSSSAVDICELTLFHHLLQ